MLPNHGLMIIVPRKKTVTETMAYRLHWVQVYGHIVKLLCSWRFNFAVLRCKCVNYFSAT